MDPFSSVRPRSMWSRASVFVREPDRGSDVTVEVSTHSRRHRPLSQYAQHDTDWTLTYHYNFFSGL